MTHLLQSGSEQWLPTTTFGKSAAIDMVVLNASPRSLYARGGCNRVGVG
jgi:hypothetical protein